MYCSCRSWIEKIDGCKNNTENLSRIFSKDNDEEPVVHSKSYNTEFMICNNADKVIKELFQSRLSRNQIGLETSMRGTGLIFYCVYLLYYKCHKTYPNRGGYV